MLNLSNRLILFLSAWLLTWYLPVKVHQFKLLFFVIFGE
jgi:hypothetical protein